MSIEQNIERIAVALEKLVNLQAGSLMGLTASKKAVEEKPVISEKVEVVGPEKVDILDRDAIKAKLTQLKVPFNDRMRTENLAAMLQEAENKKDVKPEVEAPTMFDDNKKPAPETVKQPNLSFLDTEAETAQPTEEKVYTQDEAKEHLKRFAAIAGVDKAQALLSEHGVDTLTKASQKGVLNKIVEKALSIEKERRNVKTTTASKK